MAHANSMAADSCAIQRNSVPQDGAAAQLPLRYNDRYRSLEAWQALLAEINTIVATIGLKQVAYDLDEQPSVICKALAERERHAVKAEWLPYLIEHSHSSHVIELLAGLRDLDVKPRVELSPAERLSRLDRALDEAGDIGNLIRRKAGLKP